MCPTQAGMTDFDPQPDISLSDLRHLALLIHGRLTADRLRKQVRRDSDPCSAVCPDLPKVLRVSDCVQLGNLQPSLTGSLSFLCLENRYRAIFQ
jgi:hypothetical protein